MNLISLSLYGALLGYLLYTVGPGFYHSLTVLGLLRQYFDGASVKGQVIAIPDTVHCEDLHYHPQSGTLFTACEDNAETRHKWFPPLANFDDPELASRSQGSIHVIDPKTMRSQRLQFENFDGPFITHGIDVIQDSEHTDGEAVYIFAVNHVPGTKAFGDKDPFARSQIEMFHHVVGSPSIRHIRTIWHPLIRTPNDIFAASPTSIYVTNDHRYAHHGLMRSIEDFWAGAKWTDIVHIQLVSARPSNSPAGVTATVALDKMHNNNGLGHGRFPSEILISSCTSGILHIGLLPAAGTGNLTIVDSVWIDHIADNPTYFADPYASDFANNRSGFVLAGLGRAVDLGYTMRNASAKDPVMVTHVMPTRKADRWEKRVLLEDDGSKIRTASAAVLVALDPAGERAGARKAWLFVTGFMSKSIIAVKVDL